LDWFKKYLTYLIPFNTSFCYNFTCSMCLWFDVVWSFTSDLVCVFSHVFHVIEMFNQKSLFDLCNFCFDLVFCLCVWTKPWSPIHLIGLWAFRFWVKLGNLVHMTRSIIVKPKVMFGKAKIHKKKKKNIFGLLKRVWQTRPQDNF